jgi:hypothetical protein
MSPLGCGFNRSMQHLNSNYREEDVEIDLKQILQETISELRQAGCQRTPFFFSSVFLSVDAAGQ